MAHQLIISGQTGGTPPYEFYVCDEYMNNCFLLGPTGGTFTLNTFFSTAQTLLIKIVDSTGCFTFKMVYCPFDTFFCRSFLLSWHVRYLFGLICGELAVRKKS